jgi:hypothetical protein
MSLMTEFFSSYTDEVKRLVGASSTTEPSYYPAIKALLSEMLAHEKLPFEVRASTSEGRSGGGRDLPDIALYDGQGDFIVVCGEVKLPSAEIQDLAFSTERNDQVGRYLAQTGVVLVSTVRAFGLLTVKRNVVRSGSRILPADRVLEHAVELWPSVSAMKQGKAIPDAAIEELFLLLETAVTRYAPIAEPESLAKILARQAKRAKAQLPPQFTQAVRGLADDFGKALGVSFEGEEGEEFFRSSLIQTVFYGLFAGWTLWLRSKSKVAFRWEDLSEHLKIPFLAELYYEFKHPRRIQELGLRPHLDLATETLHRVDTEAFFRRFDLPSVKNHGGDEGPQEATAAVMYFYEPFLEAFDPELRKTLGVWYTPREVVRYQVRTVDRLLREELGCDRGFADEDVVVLDPCCGTGAYLIEVMNIITEQLETEGNEALLGQTLLDAVTKRLIGFEILTAPFVVAQLQMFLILSDLGSNPTAEHRPAVFLTNALTGWGGPEQMKLHFPELQAEYDAAQAVKRGGKIIVVIGNPPYNRFAGVPLLEEADLVDHYKGIKRDKNGKQLGASDLYTRWGISKQLLDDLYIRFFRLAERCIGERAEYGVVSFISNYSFYAGRSHPIMREHLLKSFDAIWIDCLNGDKYKTGKVIPKGLPGAGTSDQSVFSSEYDPRGIQVGTGITTLLKRKKKGNTGAIAPIHYRNFWGKSRDKQAALGEAIDFEKIPAQKREAAKNRPAGPRPFEEFATTASARWKLVPFVAQGGFEEWPSIDQLFLTKFQGVNTNRGFEGSVVDTDKEVLEKRLKDYFSQMSDDRFAAKYPVLMQERAGYEPTVVRAKLKKKSKFDSAKTVPYVVFPLDDRWLYYEVEAKLLNRPRPELFEHLGITEFFVTVPEPRKTSETRPMLLKNAFDLHLHDRGSVAFPPVIRVDDAAIGSLFARAGGPELQANLAPTAWKTLSTTWKLSGELAGEDAQEAACHLVRSAMAICYAPEYQSEHKDSLAQDWIHLPIPKDHDLLLELAAIGEQVATLLDPLAKPNKVLKAILKDDLRTLAVLTKSHGGAVGEKDLMISHTFFGAAKGGWISRTAAPNESMYAEWGEQTGDLFLNPEVFYRHVPEQVWRYEIGGYPVLKKWLGYRDKSRRPDVPLSVQEANHLRSMVHRIAAVIRLQEALDILYDRAILECFTAEELGLA